MHRAWRRALVAESETCPFSFPSAGQTSFLLAGATFRFDDLAVVTQLVAPVLAVERPDDMLFIRIDTAETESLFLRPLTSRDFFVQLFALGVGDVDDDLLRAAKVFVQLVEIALVPPARQIAGAFDRRRARDADVVFDVGADGRVAEARGRGVEALELLIQDANVFDVAQELAIAESVLD